MRQLSVDLKVVLAHNEIAALGLSVVRIRDIITSNVRRVVTQVLPLRDRCHLVIKNLADWLARQCFLVINFVQHGR